MASLAARNLGLLQQRSTFARQRLHVCSAYSPLPKRKPASHYLQRSKSSARRTSLTQAIKNPKRQPRSTDDDEEEGSFLLPEWMSALYSRWQDATPSQQAYMVLAGIAALLLLPRVLILGFVGIERLFVGLLLEIEQLVVALTLKTLAATGIVIALALAAAGIYVFFLEKQRPR